MKLPPEFIHDLADHLERKARERQNDTDRIVTASGILLQWVGDFVSDPNVDWEKAEIKVDDLTLTGTNPEWNGVILETCHRSPTEFREFLHDHPEKKTVFDRATFHPNPILIRRENEKLKVLEGMHRTIAAIRDGRQTLSAWIATSIGPNRPRCEPHVVYDLIRAYARKTTTDRAGLIAALQYLRSAYSNVDQLLAERFSGSWVKDDGLQEIIDEAKQAEGGISSAAPSGV